MTLLEKTNGPLLTTARHMTPMPWNRDRLYSCSISSAHFFRFTHALVFDLLICPSNNNLYL